MECIVIADNRFDGEAKTFNGRSVLEIAEEKAKKIAQSLGGEYLLLKGDLENISSDFLKNIQSKAKDSSHIIYFTTNSVLLDVDESLRAYNEHKKYFSFYTYGENYPKGVLAEVIQTAAFERLISLAEEKKLPITSSLIYELIFDDPNFFEIEAVLSNYDLRYYRLDTRLNSKRNMLVAEKIASLGNLTYNEWAPKIEEMPSVLRSLPAYVEVALSNKLDIIPKNHPFANNCQDEHFMGASSFKTLIDNLVDFAGDIHISLGLYSEPLLNPEIKDILEIASSEKSATIYLETNGLLFDKNFSDFVIGLKANNINILFNLDCVNEKLYSKMYTNGNFSLVLENIERHLSRSSKNAYMQIIKQKENFEHLNEYYSYFEKYSTPIILKKYNTYRGILSDNRVGDLTPLVRPCCWHLARDIYILSSGGVILCKEDFKKENILGNVFEESLQAIWQRGDEYHEKSAKGTLDYCKNCDEWYTYNF